MALRVHLLCPKLLPQPLKFQTHPFPSMISVTNPSKLQTSCTKNKSPNDADLSSDLATEVERLNTHLVQREEAMKKSRELLFTELCQYMDLKSEEMKKKWKQMKEEDKWVLVKEFVAEWSANFHPLSARSVKELVDEHLLEENPSPNSSDFDSDSDSNSDSVLFPGLKKLMGFSP
ncbi:unnamed protein product [Ilex paraguariensis]|uniref:DUF7026 domain-containing protein n=1 Tax=Ilex paraguariensis TaxID=185542 RepID=A0ABC8QW18_9AQUA